MFDKKTPEKPSGPGAFKPPKSNTASFISSIVTGRRSSLFISAVTTGSTKANTAFKE